MFSFFTSFSRVYAAPPSTKSSRGTFAELDLSTSVLPLAALSFCKNPLPSALRYARV